MNHAEEIKKFFKGDVDDSQETLEKYSRDASLFYIKPKLVVFPKDTEDIKNLVAYTNHANGAGENLSLAPRSAGTDMTGGPLTESIVVEFIKYFNKIKEIGSDFAITEPGVFFRDFDKETASRGLMLPSYPASRELCAMGGIVANNSGGEKTLKYGKTEDYVLELKMVLADGNEYVFKKLSQEELLEKKSKNNFEGEIYKRISGLIEKNFGALNLARPQVTKNSSGYFLWNVLDKNSNTFDINKLLTGSQGTLGIITEMKLRLVKVEPATRLLVMFLENMEYLGDITPAILKYKPESFESYDDNTFRLAIKFFPEILERVKGSIFKIALSLIPEAFMLLRGGIPKLALMAEFTGATAEEAAKQAYAAEEEIKKKFPKLKMRVTKSDEETEEFWLIRRESFNLLRHHVRGLRTAPFIDDFSVRADHLPEFLPELYKIMQKYKLLYTVAGHIGDGNFHIIPLMDLSKPEAKDIIINLSREVYGLVLKYKGSITGEHNDGLIRGPFLKEEFGEEIYKLFEKTKNIFDPQNIFNPGKKVGASLEYALDHLDKKM